MACEHNDVMHLAGSGYQSKWSCRNCNEIVRGGFNDDGDFVEFKRGTWP